MVGDETTVRREIANARGQETDLFDPSRLVMGNPEYQRWWCAAGGIQGLEGDLENTVDILVQSAPGSPCPAEDLGHECTFDRRKILNPAQDLLFS